MNKNAIGRSSGGLSTKVHLVVDALGLPVEYKITEGQRHDLVVASDLIERIKPNCLLADKAYNSDAFRQQLNHLQCIDVIPPKVNRIVTIDYDKNLYQARSEIECTFNLLKQARRFATRYEKTLRNYAAVIAIGCSMLWLRI
ncbi:MAG: IS5 family transposase [Deltaproteobacteria bacterium]|nr:IS5 family transposase [Deltaproteobacteria bacterium]